MKLIISILLVLFLAVQPSYAFIDYQKIEQDLKEEIEQYIWEDIAKQLFPYLAMASGGWILVKAFVR